tara:strand:- start:21 stop:2267 length:2247 start_codon:yes stop_codon:yes gene_type:complete
MSGSEKLHINSSGQVLIGTTAAPSDTDTLLRVHLPISSSSDDAIEISHNTNGADKAGAAFGLAINNGGASTNAADLIISTASGGSLSERLRITSAGVVWAKDGKIQLGTTSGQDNYIYATNAAGIIYQADENGHKFQTYSGSWLDRLTIQDGGNVLVPTGNLGVGNRTSSPSALLHVHTASGDCTGIIEGGSHARFRLTAHSGASILEFGDAGSDSVGKITYTHSSNNMSFRTNGTDRLTLQSSGRLELIADEGIFVKSSTDNGGAQIRFSTNTQGTPYSQIGHIKYFHGDNHITTNYGEGLIIGGTETNGFVMRVDGAIHIKDSDSAGGDGAKLLFGTDRDMRIYHSGGDGFYDLTGSGGMRFRVNDLIFQNYNTSGTRRCRFYADEGIEIYTVTNAAGGASGGAVIKMSDASDFSQFGKIRYVHTDNSIVNDSTNDCFVMEGSETQTAFKLEGRFYMSDDKFVMKPTFSNFDDIPNASNSGNSQGVMMRCDGSQSSGGNSGVMSNNQYEPFIANRTGNDGIIMRIRHQGNTEGYIGVSGGSVSYNTFMGAHKAQFVDHSKPDILIGTVMETVDQIATWKYASFSVGVGTAATTKYIPYYGSKNDSETDTITFESNTYNATIKNYRDPMPEMTKHVCVKVSDTVGSKAVFGVFNSWEEDTVVERESGNAEVSWNDLDVASIGDYYIRMQSGQTLEIGDYVESAGDGTAKVQSDDILRSKTIAKITSTTKQKTYSDGSFLVTCTLHCG